MYVKCVEMKYDKNECAHVNKKLTDDFILFLSLTFKQNSSNPHHKVADKVTDK